MKQYLIRRFLLSVLCLPSVLQISFAQATKAENVIGKITGRSADGQSWHFEMRNLLEANSRYYPQMKKELMQIFQIAIKAPAVNPLKGFDANPDLVAYQQNGLLPAAREISGEISFMCFNFTKNRNGKPGFHKEGESHGGLSIQVNLLSKCYSDKFKNVCDDFGVPIFFSRPEVETVSQGILKIRKDIIILKKPGKPVFIPLSKKEYLKFLLNRITPALKEVQHNLRKLVADTSNYKKKIKTEKQEYKNIKNGKLKIKNKFQRNTKTMMDSIDIALYAYKMKSYRKGIATDKQQIANLKKLIPQYKTKISDGSSTDLQAGAYINENNPEELPVENDNIYFRPVASNSPNSKALYQINPDYYDYSLPKTDPQVIIVSWHASGFCPPFEKKALQRWFNQINYEKLQSVIK